MNVNYERKLMDAVYERLNGSKEDQNETIKAALLTHPDLKDVLSDEISVEYIDLDDHEQDEVL